MPKFIIQRRKLIHSFLLKTLSLLGASTLSFFPAKVVAKNRFYGFRISNSDDKTRVVADFSSPFKYSSLILQKPLRAVFDVENSIFSPNQRPSFSNDKRIKEIRYGQFKGKFRIVLELRRSARIKSFVLKPKGKYTYRLVIDISDYNKAQKTNLSKPNEQKQKIYHIMIDAGHGGKDPGAIGRAYKTKEKTIVLDIAKKLAQLINNHPQMKAYLTRNGDYYLSLRKRITKAKTNTVDLFLSIHADSAPNKKASGSSVYVLSNKGASGEFERLLAQRENAADFVGGIDSTSGDLNDLLLSVVQNDTIDKSRLLAEKILHQLGRYHKLHSKKVKHAGFVVLKSPHIPSVLVETAFISNAEDERLLRKNSIRKNFAKLIYQGILDYLNV